MLHSAIRFGAIALAFLTFGLGPQAEETIPRRIAPTVIPEYRPGPITEPQYSVELPTAEKPTGACVVTMRRAIWLRCLRETVALLHQRLDQAVEGAKGTIEGRGDVTAARKRYWVTGFDDVQQKWAALRDLHCQRVAPSETGAPKDAYEANLLCLIRENPRRLDELAAGYQAGP